VDLDNDVDLDDFGYFAKCYTGSIPTDRLCECRFLDIDHDRDVDSDDFALFMENYTGEPLDCHGHTLQDRFDMMLAGTLIDCNANGAPDDCDLSGGVSQDINANAIPDACDCPTLDTVGFEPLRRPKNRYLTVEPGNAGVSTAIRVTLTGVNGLEPFNGQTRWAGPPSSNPDENSSDAERTMTAAELQCDPHYLNWGDLGRIHLFGAEIVPDSTYDVQVVQEGCESIFTDRRNYSEPFTFRTGKWGDLVEPFSGSFDAGAQPDFTDIAALVTKFTADPQSPDKARMQLQPNTPDPSQPITFSDIANVVDAFTGSPYPFAGPTECP
jgi:hypothetical protein